MQIDCSNVSLSSQSRGGGQLCFFIFQLIIDLFHCKFFFFHKRDNVKSSLSE